MGLPVEQRIKVGKHAYLIMAHNNINILKILLEMIDDSRNDIYIHIDAKTKEFPFNEIKNICNFSDVYFTTKRYNVKWGGSSQVKTEMLLYRSAAPGKYNYYHLLSGVDLPLKTQNEIHDFFDRSGKEFIYYKNDYTKWDYYRLARYRFPKWWNKRIVGILNLLQEKMKVDRLKKYKMEFRRGFNWCSLTHEAVDFLLRNENFIFHICRMSVCADECYKQFLFFNSDFRNRIYIDESGNPSDMREVDWKRRVIDSPHVYTMDDYNLLVRSNKMFARKFDKDVDMNIVLKIREFVQGRDNDL